MDGTGADSKVEVQHAGLVVAGDPASVLRPAVFEPAEDLGRAGARVGAYVDAHVGRDVDVDLADAHRAGDRGDAPRQRGVAQVDDDSTDTELVVALERRAG